MKPMSLIVAVAAIAAGVFIIFRTREAGQPAGGAENVWAEHTQGLPFVIGYEEGMKQAKAEGKPALVFATASWCGPCKMFAHENFTSPLVQQKLKQFTLVLVDVDTDPATGALGVAATPTNIFLGLSGKELGRVVGYRGAEDFSKILGHVLDDAKAGLDKQVRRPAEEQLVATAL